MQNLLSLIGLVAVGVLMLSVLKISCSSSDVFKADDTTPTVTFLAVGDINLGRKVGQEILRGDTLYPFRNVIDVFQKFDIVFGNLECTLSDQKGETQHPRNNLIFTGPPAGAMSLKRGGVTVVSTANNHALDYGLKAHAETIENLTAADVPFVGTSLDSSKLFEPLMFTTKSIRFALFACTDIMNTENTTWKRYVASCDTARLFPRMRLYRDSVDVLMVSYHGGEEYTTKATPRTVTFARDVMNAGADVFLGHHPHVPHALKMVKGKPVAYSLGNFVFYQPFAEWTQKSFGLSMTITKTSRGMQFDVDCRPLMTGLQPYFTSDSAVVQSVYERVLESATTTVTIQ